MSEAATISRPEAEHGEFDGFSLTLTANPNSDTWRVATDIEASVFEDSGYIEDKAELEEEYAPYLEHTHMLLLAEEGRPIGSIRFIEYDPDSSFKTIRDAQAKKLIIDAEGEEILERLDPDKIFEVGTLGIDQGVRAKPREMFMAVTQLYGSILNFGIEKQKPNVLASFDEKYLRRFRSFFGPSVRPLGPAVDYMGSPTVPVIMNLNTLEEHLKSIDAEKLFDSMLGVGRKIEHEL